MCTNNNSPEFNLMVGDVERFLKQYKEDPYYRYNGPMPRWSFDPWDLKECNENAIYAEFLSKTELDNIKVLAERWTTIFNKVNNKTKANLLEATDEVMKEMNEWFAFVAFTKNNEIARKVLTKHGFEIHFYSLSAMEASLQYDIMCFNWKKIKEYNELKKHIKTHTKINEKEKKKNTRKRPSIKLMTLWDLWWNHPNRRIFIGKEMNPKPIEIDPEIRNQFALNLFHGFATGFGRDDVLQCTDFQRTAFFLNHLRHVWCANEDEFCFLLGWMARLLQKPWEKQGVCVCVGGKEGTGKTLPFLMLGRIIGNAHFGHCHTSSDIVGEFTPFTNKILVFMDEAVFSGNHQQANILKNLITAPTTRERKMFQDPRFIESYVNVCLATNHEDAMVMADAKMRRFFHLQAKLEPLMNHPVYKEAFGNDPHCYFDVLAKSLEDDDYLGLKTFANLLYNLPLDNYNPVKVPLTHLLFMNKLNGPRIYSWWLECLENGYVYEDIVYSNGVPIPSQAWLFKLNEKDVYASYQNAEKDKKEIKHIKAFRNQFKKICPRVSIKEEIIERKKYRFYLIPDLKECLSDFDQVFPGALAHIKKNRAADQTRKRAEILGMLPKNPIEEKAKKLQEQGYLSNTFTTFDGQYYDREIQLGSLTKNDLFRDKYLPADFFGYPLMASILDKSFVIRNSIEFSKFIEGDGFQTKNSEKDKKAQKILDNLMKTNSNSNSNPNINPNKLEVDSEMNQSNDLLAHMDQFLVKLPMIQTQNDGKVNTAKGDFGFPLELKVVLDEKEQEVAAAVEDNAAFINDKSNEYMEMD